MIREIKLKRNKDASLAPLVELLCVGLQYFFPTFILTWFVSVINNKIAQRHFLYQDEYQGESE